MSRVLLHLLLLLSVIAACHGSCSGGYYACLKWDVHRALRKIETSQNYTLLPGLGFERSSEANVTADVSSSKEDAVPGLGDLVGQTEALFKSHALYWTFLPGVDLSVSKSQTGDFSMSVRKSVHGVRLPQCELSTTQQETTDLGGRTFGVVRRLKMALLPIMYKLGVITTLLTMLTVFALKSLAIGVVLLVLTAGGVLAKLKHGFHGHHHHGGWDYPPSGWAPDYPHHSPHHKDVHIHLHGQHPHRGEHYWQRIAEEAPTSPTGLADMPYSGQGWKYMPPY